MVRTGTSLCVAAIAAALGLGACTSLLGDFTVGDGGQDVTTDVGVDVGVDSGPDVTPDVGVDAPADVDAGPTCGNFNQQCCGGTTCNQGKCCNNTCQDVSTDGKNCGACGHDCQGGTCASNKCQPQQLTKISDTRPGRVRLDQSNAYFITVNGSGKGSLYSCSLQGCSAPNALLKSNIGYAYDLVIDSSGYTYVADFNNQKLWTCIVNGCNNTPGYVSTAANGSFAGLALRSELFAVISTAPHEFTSSGGSDVSLGNGNEGANWIAAPTNSQYVYWNGPMSVRVAKDNTAQSSTDFWQSTSEQVSLVEASDAYVLWRTTQSLYTCLVGASCSNTVFIESGDNIGSEDGAILMEDGTKMAYWVATDSNASHVNVRSCSAGGCNGSPDTVGSVSTNPGKAVAGAVTSNGTFIYFTMEDAGTVYLYRIAK